MPSIQIENQCIHFKSATDMSVLDPDSVDLIITSPPYWNLKDYGASPEEVGSGDYDNYINELNLVWDQCFRVAKQSAVLIVNVNSRRVAGRFYPIHYDIVSSMRQWAFWDENIWYIPNALPQPNAYRERLLDNKFETLLVFHKGNYRDYRFSKPRVPQKYASADPRANKNLDGRCLGNILRIPAYRPPNIKQMGYHVAAYPEELVAFFIKAYSAPGDTVLDPFLGSGTTLKVAQSMGRKGVGFEVHEDYAELIHRRVSEDWAEPDWRDIDLIHSSVKEPKARPRRRPKMSDLQDVMLDLHLHD